MHSTIKVFLRSLIQLLAVLLVINLAVMFVLAKAIALECRNAVIPLSYRYGNKPADIIETASLSPDGKQIVAAQVSGVYIYDADTLKPTSVLACRLSQYDPISPVVWSPDGLKIATFTETDGITIWDAETKARLFTLRDESDPGIYNKYGELNSAHRVYELVWSSDSHYIAAGGEYMPFRVWDLQSRKIVFEYNVKIAENQTSPGQLLWSKDGSRFFLANFQRILMWETGNWQIVGELHPQVPYGSSIIDSLSLSDANELASAGQYNDLQIWDLNTKTPVALDNEQNAIVAHTVSWLKGSKRLAIATDPGNRPDRNYSSVIEILDFPTGNVLQKFTGHTGTVNSIQWYPDGKRLLSLETHFPTTRLIEWDVETGEKLAEFSINPNVKAS